MTGGELGIGRDHPEVLLAGERLFAHPVPALVELAPVLGRPLRGDVMGGVGGAGRVVGEERLVAHQRLLRADPGDRLVGHVLGEVIPLLGGAVRLDRLVELVERRVPLVGLPADEPVEVLEPATRMRPVIERAHRARLPHRHLVALAELRRRVAVQLQRLRQRRRRVRTQRVVARRRRGDLGDPAHPHRVMVATRQHRRPRRRAQRRGVEPGELQPAGGQLLGDRRATRTTERARRPEPDIIEQDHQHVRRARWRSQRLDRRIRRLRILGIKRQQPDLTPIRNRQHLPRSIIHLATSVTVTIGPTGP